MAAQPGLFTREPRKVAKRDGGLALGLRIKRQDPVKQGDKRHAHVPVGLNCSRHDCCVTRCRRTAHSNVQARSDTHSLVLIHRERKRDGEGRKGMRRSWMTGRYCITICTTIVSNYYCYHNFKHLLRGEELGGVEAWPAGELRKGIW